MVLTALLVVVLGIHVASALRVGPLTAQRWGRTRGLTLNDRLTEQLVRHLRRIRWARAGATTVLGSASLALALLHQPAISFLSLPLLLAVLAAHLLVPEPRRGRVRTAALERRPSSYFAPRRTLTLVRCLLPLAVAASTYGVLTEPRLRTMLLVHLASLVLGAAALERALLLVTRRGLPDRTDDLALDCALRVADARTVTAAGLVFSAVGLALGSAALFRDLGPQANLVFSPLVSLGLPGAVIAAIILTRPLPSWRPA